MKVLLVNRYLYRRGGDATYTLSLARLLQEKGHEVVCFGLRAPENDRSVRAPVLVDPIDFPALLEAGGFAGALKVLRRTIYSREARERMEQVLDAERPQIVHLQNIHHHLSPSVIAAAYARRIPVVWTLHDYSVICPNGNLYSNGRTCEECRLARFHRMVVNRCKRGSLGASLVAALESAVHRAMGIFDRVDAFIAPSRFLAAKLRHFGFFPERVVHIDNFIAIPAVDPPGPPPAAKRVPGGPGYLLYAGRLAADKGIGTLLEAAGRWGDIPLKIAGDGPLRGVVLEACRRQPRIEYLGQVGPERVRDLLRGAVAAVVPSDWYENQPYAVLEAFAAGRSVIGSDHGAIPELLGDGERGLLFRPGDPDDLARTAARLAADPVGAARMGAAGFRLARERFSPQAHYDELTTLYERVQSGVVGDAA